MPVVDASSLETTLPGATRRRIWLHPELKSHSLVVLTFERLHVTPLAGTPTPDLVTAVEAGQNLDELLGPLAVVVDLIAVRQLKLDLLTNSLIIEYVKNGLETSRLTVAFTTSEAADAFFMKLWRRLGDGFQLQPYKRDAWSAARSPLVLLVGALLTTAILALVLSIFEDMASARVLAQANASELGINAPVQAKLTGVCLENLASETWAELCSCISGFPRTQLPPQSSRQNRRTHPTG